MNPYENIGHNIAAVPIIYEYSKVRSIIQNIMISITKLKN